MYTFVARVVLLLIVLRSNDLVSFRAVASNSIRWAQAAVTLIVEVARINLINFAAAAVAAVVEVKAFNRSPCYMCQLLQLLLLKLGTISHVGIVIKIDSVAQMKISSTLYTLMQF